MIEHSHRTMPSFSADTLQRRVQRQRKKHRQPSSQFTNPWRQSNIEPATAIRLLSHLPARFALHALIVFVLPLALVLSQLPPGTLQSTSAPATPPTTSDFVVPVAPLSLDAQEPVGDPPLIDEEIPVPLSLVNRSEVLAPAVVPASVAAERVILRGGPGTGYDALGKLDGGAPLQVIGRYNDWFQVREKTDAPVYWVSAELLNVNAEDAALLTEVAQDVIPALPPPKVGTVREDGLKLRDGPGTDYVPMTKLDAGTQLDLIEIYQDWYHVGVPSGADGWVKGEFLDVHADVLPRISQALEIPDPNPALVGTIIENSVNLRKGPDSKYDKLGSVNASTSVDLLGKFDDWFKIKTSNGTTAWVFSDFLKTTPHVARRVPVTKDFPALPKPAASTRSSASSADLASIAASGDVASFAAKFAGSRYVWGGASPRGFDCSGLNMYVYKQFGVSLPHSAAAQYSSRYGTIIGSMRDLAAGDLVFFVGTGGGRGITHTGIYLGGGRIVHAMTPKYGVQISNIYDRYWSSHYYGGLRVRR